jgi:hypothetical protein
MPAPYRSPWRAGRPIGVSLGHDDPAARSVLLPTAAARACSRERRGANVSFSGVSLLHTIPNMNVTIDLQINKIKSNASVQYNPTMIRLVERKDEQARRTNTYLKGGVANAATITVKNAITWRFICASPLYSTFCMRAVDAKLGGGRRGTALYL